MLSRTSYPLIGVMVAALAAIALTAYVAWRIARPAPITAIGTTISVAVAPQIKVGGPFELTNHGGEQVTDADFRGKFMLVYFGYGFCPDICPTELQNMTVALDSMGAAAGTIQPIFITVDPERDSVEFLADYVSNFHSSFVGLTGTRAEIEETTRLYRVYHAKAKGEPAEDYLVDHSGFVYLMGRDGAFLTMFRGGTGPENMAATIADYLEKTN